MFAVKQYDLLTDVQQTAWTDLLTVLQELAPEDGSGAGWLFHGTDQISATYIMKEGFRSRVGGQDVPDYGYFGCLGVAASFSLKRMSADSPPAILAIRSADLMLLDVHSDPNYEDDVPENWLEYVGSGGTIRLKNQETIQGLVHFGISHLPLHPSASYDRSRRIMNGYSQKVPHPDETANVKDLMLSPLSKLDLTPERAEAFLAENPTWPRDVPYTQENWRHAVLSSLHDNSEEEISFRL